MSHLLPFQFQNMPVRGRILRLTGLNRFVLTLRDNPSRATAHLLAELLAAAALLVHDSKHQASVNLQVQNVSRKTMAFAHCSTECHLKAYANEEMQQTDFATLGQLPDSHFAVTMDPGEGQPYQSLVPLIHPSAAKALEHYFTASVQTPTWFRVATHVDAMGDLHAGAVFLQVMPHVDGAPALVDDDWNRLNLLLNTLKPDELANPSLPSEKLLAMLFAEDTLRVAKPEELFLQSDDPRPRMLAALATLPRENLRELLEADDPITLTDQTSGEAITFTAAELAHLLDDTTTKH
jgi:molecular chaperone Hsp33